MRRKTLLSLILVAVLAFSLGMGTLSLYRKTFTSEDNVVRAAIFDVDTNGTLDEEVEFDLTDDPLYPGRELDVYEFEIHKNNTEVPVKYDINVEGVDELFEGNTPVALTVLRKVEGDWQVFEGPELEDPAGVEEFKINLKWDHTDYDIDYQGKTGRIKINVVATQVEGPVEPGDPGEEPGDPDEEPRVIAQYYKKSPPGFDAGTNIKIETENIEGAAKVRIRYTSPTTGGRVSSNTFNLGEWFRLSSTLFDLEDIDIYIYDTRGPLDEFGRPIDPLHVFYGIDPELVPGP